MQDAEADHCACWYSNVHCRTSLFNQSAVIPHNKSTHSKLVCISTTVPVVAVVVVAVVVVVVVVVEGVDVVSLATKQRYN